MKTNRFMVPALLVGFLGTSYAIAAEPPPEEPARPSEGIDKEQCLAALIENVRYTARSVASRAKAVQVTADDEPRLARIFSDIEARANEILAKANKALAEPRSEDLLETNLTMLVISVNTMYAMAARAQVIALRSPNVAAKEAAKLISGRINTMYRAIPANAPARSCSE